VLRADLAAASRTGAADYGAEVSAAWFLATGSTDGAIRLYDLRTQPPLGARYPPCPTARSPPVHPRRQPPLRDYRRRTRLPLDVRPPSWARHACAVAGRTPPTPGARTSLSRVHPDAQSSPQRRTSIGRTTALREEASRSAEGPHALALDDEQASARRLIAAAWLSHPCKSGAPA